MGYGFLEFTSKSSAIKARNELHGYEFIYRDGKKYRIQVHWIDRIPDNYEDLQRQGSPDTCLSYWDCPLEWSVDPFYSCTVYCQLPDNIEWQNGGQIEDELHRFLSQKFDLVYFDCSKMKSDNFCIAEYGKFTRLNLHIRLRKFQTPQSKQQWLFDIFNQVHFRDMVQHHHFKSLFLFQILPEKFYSNHFRLFMNR